MPRRSLGYFVEDHPIPDILAIGRGSALIQVAAYPDRLAVAPKIYAVINLVIPSDRIRKVVNLSGYIVND